MLTFILLVVLGGGAGLWVVSMAEASKPATAGSRPSRAPVRELLARFTAETKTPEGEPEPEPEHEPVADREPEPAGVEVRAHEPAPLETESRRTRRAHARAGGRVPKAYTAVEGRFADVARVPLWRRVLSLIGIVVIAGLVGVGIAAVLGAAFAAVAEIFSNTIG